MIVITLLHLQRLLLCITSIQNSRRSSVCILRVHTRTQCDIQPEIGVHVQRQHFAVHSPFGRVYRYRSFPGSTERASFLLPAGRDTLIPSAREQSGSHHENLAVFQSTMFTIRSSGPMETLIYSATRLPYTSKSFVRVMTENEERSQWKE